METILIEKIEAYLQGDLEKQVLEEFATSNGIEDLDKEIEWVKNTQLAIEADGIENQLKQIIKDASSKNTGKVVNINNQKPARGKYTALSIAASIVLLFGVLFIFKPSNTNKLYSKYEFVDPGIPVLMSETDRYELYEALSYYSEQNYSETIQRLSSIKAKQSDTYNDTVEFYLGISKLYSKNIEESLPLIEEVSNDNNSIFKERAEWLYVLALLKSGDIEQSKLLLQSIVENGEHPFNHQAIALLSDLKK